MKNKPSDYQKMRFLKRENIPDGGTVFTISEIDEVDKSKFADKPDWCIQLVFDEHWRLDLRGSNLDTVIELLGNDFEKWHNIRLGARIATFKAKDGSEHEWIQLCAAPIIELRRKGQRKPAVASKGDDSDEIPF